METKINPREFIRRALKMFFIFLILYLTLINNGKLDYINELGGSYFKIENPNSKANCGCGTSFSI